MSTTDTQHADQSPLRSDLGTTTIQKPVLNAIIGMAAQEVEGVAMSHGGTRLPGDTSPTVGEFVANLTGGGRTRGLSVDGGRTSAGGRAGGEPDGSQGERGEHRSKRREPAGRLAGPRKRHPKSRLC